MPRSRISTDHRVMGGTPCIQGTRVPVATIVGLIAQGQSPDDIIADFPQLTTEDVRSALEFAADAVMERQIPLPAHA